MHICTRIWLQCVAVYCNAYHVIRFVERVMQCVAVCCSVLQCVAVCCIVLQCVAMCCNVLQCVAVCCSVLQCASCNQTSSNLADQHAHPWVGVAMCCRVLQCFTVWSTSRFYSMLQCVAVCCSVLQCVAVYCSVLQYVAMCCSVLQCVAVCCSVSQCVAVSIMLLDQSKSRRSAYTSTCNATRVCVAL